MVAKLNTNKHPMTLELLKSKTGCTLIGSYRGVEGDVPENSWSAIQLGHQLGADLRKERKS